MRKLLKKQRTVSNNNKNDKNIYGMCKIETL